MGHEMKRNEVQCWRDTGHRIAAVDMEDNGKEEKLHAGELWSLKTRVPPATEPSHASRGAVRAVAKRSMPMETNGGFFFFQSSTREGCMLSPGPAAVPNQALHPTPASRAGPHKACSRPQILIGPRTAPSPQIQQASWPSILWFCGEANRAGGGGAADAAKRSPSLRTARAIPVATCWTGLRVGSRGLGANCCDCRSVAAHLGTHVGGVRGSADGARRVVRNSVCSGWFRLAVCGTHGGEWKIKQTGGQLNGPTQTDMKHAVHAVCARHTKLPVMYICKA